MPKAINLKFPQFTFRAGLAAEPAAYPRSSAAAHLAGRDYRLVKVAPLLRLEPDWGAFLAQGVAEGQAGSLRRGERTGRPAGSDEFVAALEALIRRTLRRQKPGPKRNAAS